MAAFLVPEALNGLALVAAPTLFIAPEFVKGRSFLAPQLLTPDAIVVVPRYGVTGAFLAPPLFNGLPYLAPPVAKEAPDEVVATLNTTVFLAPPLFNGLAYLAPEVVPAELQTTFGARASRSRARTASVKTVAPAQKSAPRTDASTYHSRSDEQERLLAAQLDDEEVVIAFLMELALS